jgi:hypothetical protein
VQLQNRTHAGFLENLRQLVFSAVSGKICEEQRVFAIISIATCSTFTGTARRTRGNGATAVARPPVASATVTLATVTLATVTLATVALPTVALPTVTLPTVSWATIALPAAVALPTTIAALPTVALPAMAWPSMGWTVAAERAHGDWPAIVQRPVESAPHLLSLILRGQGDEAKTSSFAGLTISGNGDFRHLAPRCLEQFPQLVFVDAFGQARNEELASIGIGHVSRRGGLENLRKQECANA